MKRLMMLAAGVLAAGLAAGCSKKAEHLTYVGVLQMVPNAAPDQVREGFVKAMADAGYVQDKNVHFDFQNAQGEMPNTQLAMQKFVADKADLLFAIGTPPLQAAVKAAPPTTPVVFAYASDPWGAGAGKTPDDHLPNCAGTIGTNPVDAEAELIKEMLPQAKKIGLVYNPGEPNSRYEGKLFKEAVEKLGLEFVEQSVSGPQEVLQAAQSLTAKGVDAIGKVGDYATISAWDSLVKQGREAKVPIFSVDQPDIEKGAILTIGWSYFDDGYTAGQIAVRVLKGESPAKMPFQPLTKRELEVSLPNAAAFGVKVPDSILKKASKVIR